MELERFILAQERTYEIALSEIKNGKKTSHWMWYIFPQIIGLGKSTVSKYYEIKSIEEANLYLSNDILSSHLIEICTALLELPSNNSIEILGSIDSLKLKSSMTLFAYISDNEIFTKILDKFYQGEKDAMTIQICENLNSNKKVSTLK